MDRMIASLAVQMLWALALFGVAQAVGRAVATLARTAMGEVRGPARPRAAQTVGGRPGLRRFPVP
ncbi:hypothetical protein [Oceaniglobus roseus]|uniref:hypothetical protein n=1 Tax=Oceaniglobus roseus TaxID=1737570 RepID=UPI000C7E9E2D|nr:hypothetical protein [Kandeliimicrobium roseum]